MSDFATVSSKEFLDIQATTEFVFTLKRVRDMIVTYRQFNQVIMEQDMIVIRDPKTYCFNFDWPKDYDENLKHEIVFIIKDNESLADNKTKNEIEQLLLKYKRGNNIHKHGEKQNK